MSKEQQKTNAIENILTPSQIQYMVKRNSVATEVSAVALRKNDVDWRA